MADTTFSAGTVVASSWLNDVNDHVYGVTPIRGMLSVSQFPGADPTGVADSTTAIVAALAASITLQTPLLIDGRFRYTSQIVIPAKVRLHGNGFTSDSSIPGRSASCLIKDFNGTFATPTSSAGVLFSGDDSSAEGVQFDSVLTATGDGVQVTGSRVCLLNSGATNAGGDGLRIGATELGPSSINANCGSLLNWQSLNCGGWGVQFDHTNTSTSGTFPLGAPDCNAWTVHHVCVGATAQPCTLGGVKFGNSIDNVVTFAVIQDNTGPAIKFTTGARGHIITAYCEGNGSAPVFDAGAKFNVLRQAGTLISGNADTLDNDGTNTISYALSAVNGFVDNRVQVASLVSGGSADITLYADVGAIDAVRLRGSQSTGTSGLFTLQTRTNGSVLTDRFKVDGAARALFKNLAEGVLFNKDVADTTTPGVNILGGAVARTDHVNSGTGSQIVHAFYNGNGFVGSVSTSGTSTAYNVSSDYRLKEKVQPVDNSVALASVMSWPIRSFTWKVNGKQDIGVIAHELQDIEPDAVTGEKDAVEMQGVDYSKLVPKLVAAVQYLATEVERLKNG